MGGKDRAAIISVPYSPITNGQSVGTSEAPVSTTDAVQYSRDFTATERG
jgi:hypothetical protein